MSKNNNAEWQRHAKEIGQELPKLTANTMRKLFVSTSREAGASRAEQELLAHHMAHNVSTADRIYDKSERKEGRERVVTKVVDVYKVRHDMVYLYFITVLCSPPYYFYFIFQGASKRRREEQRTKGNQGPPAKVWITHMDVLCSHSQLWYVSSSLHYSMQQKKKAKKHGHTAPDLPETLQQEGKMDSHGTKTPSPEKVGLLHTTYNLSQYLL